MNRLRLTALSLSALVLSSCSVFSQKSEETPATTPQATPQKAADKLPAAEQARTLAESGEGTTAATTLTNTDEAVRAETVSNLLPAYEQTEAPATSTAAAAAIPGRSGMRMGRFAPPEEAASSSEKAAPTPNAAELRGLRSPSLPKNLPLDINGQSKKN